MNKDQKYFHNLLDRAVALEYAPGEGQETTWEECLDIVHKAGERANRLGLLEIAAKARRFKLIATPGEAQAVLGECLAALRPTPAPAAADEMLNLKQAAAYLGYGSRGLREIVDRTRKSRARQHVVGPTIEFSQGGKGGTILFRREWLDDFIEANRVRPATLPPTPKARKRAAKPGTEMAAAWNALARQ
jgi:hypothetical protein